MPVERSRGGNGAGTGELTGVRRPRALHVATMR